MSEKPEQQPEPDRVEPDKDRQAPAPPASKQGSPAEDETESISLLDLIDEAAGTNNPPASRQPVSPDDQETPTGPPIPLVVPYKAPKAPLPPLFTTDRTLSSPPPLRDRDATQVQPRVAFPGSTDPLAHQGETPAPMPASGQQEQPPVSERPVRRHLAPPRRNIVRRQVPRASAPPDASPRVRPQPQSQRRNWGGCLLRLTLIGIMLLVAAVFFGAAASVIGYTSLAGDLPSPRRTREPHQQIRNRHHLRSRGK